MPDQSPAAIALKVAGSRQNGRRIWNGWISPSLTDVQRTALEQRAHALEREFEPLSNDEVRQFDERARRQSDGWPGLRNVDPPTLNEEIMWNNPIDLDFTLTCRSFVFPFHLITLNGDFRFGVLFEHAKFLGGFGMPRCLIWRESRFERTSIDGNVDFSESIFFNHASFYGAELGKFATFEKAQFHGDVNFDESALPDEVSFKSAKFYGVSVFRNAEFQGELYFERASFNARTSFKGAVFHTSPPYLYHADLNQDISWLDTKWPRPPERREDADAHRRAYQRLKVLMDIFKKLDDEQEFFYGDKMARSTI